MSCFKAFINNIQVAKKTTLSVEKKPPALVPSLLRLIISVPESCSG